jgi:hypothetical protein
MAKEDISDTDFALGLGIGGSILVILNVIAIFYLGLLIRKYKKKPKTEIQHHDQDGVELKAIRF